MSFQGLAQLWRRDGEAIGQLRLSTAVENEAGAYQIHPAFLDAAFQALAAALPRGDAGQSEGSIFLPVRLDTLRMHARPGAISGATRSCARERTGSRAPSKVMSA